MSAPDKKTDRVALLARPDHRCARLALRDGLRSARSEVLADAEGFMVVVSAIERLGQWLTPKGTSLRGYEPGLRALAHRTGAADSAVFARELFVLRESRNDAAHGGAAARHATEEALRVSMVLEEALSVLEMSGADVTAEGERMSWEKVTAAEVMTRNPVVAESWQLVADIRRTLLTRGFTALPYRSSEGDAWQVLTDESLARWLNEPEKSRNKRLQQPLREAVDSRLHLDPAASVGPDSTVPQVAKEKGLRLVTNEGAADGTLLGVIASADLL